MASAICLVNGTSIPTSGTSGYNASAGVSVTISLANSGGVSNGWSIFCTNTDGSNPLSTPALINSTRVVNQSNFTATFTTPAISNGIGSAMQWTSIVNPNTSTQQTFTFGIFVIGSTGFRMGFAGETTESNATVGCVADFNALVNGIQDTNTVNMSGDITGTNSASVVSAISGNSPIKITPAVLEWTKAIGSPTITQITPTTDASVNNLTIQSQAPFSGASVNTSPGNIILSIPAPVGGGNSSQVIVENGGTQMIYLGTDLSGTANAKIWMGPGLSITTSNYTLRSDGSSKTTLNGAFGELLLLVPLTGSIVQQLGTQIVANVSLTGNINTQNANTNVVQYAYITTTNNTPTAAYTITLPSGSASFLTVQCVARDVSSGTVGDAFLATQNVLVKNVGGTASVVSAGSATKLNDSSMSSCNLTYSAATNVITILVTGISATVDWTLQITNKTC